MKKLLSLLIILTLGLTSCAKKEKRPEMSYDTKDNGAPLDVNVFDEKGTARAFKREARNFHKDTQDIMGGTAAKESKFKNQRRVSLDDKVFDEDGKEVEFKIQDLNSKIKKLETLPVTLKFNSIDIKSALRLFAGLVKRNIIIGKDVNAEITLDFQDINWGSAMYVILDMNDLVMTEDSNSGLLRVDTKTNFVEAIRSKVNRTKELASLQTGTVPGGTTADTQAAADGDGADNVDNITEIFRVFHNTSGAMSGTLTAVIEGLTVQNDEINNQLFITGTKEQLDEVEKILNKVDVPKQAVMIEAYIVNASDGFAESFDANLQAGAASGARTTGNNITQVEVTSPGISAENPNVGGGEDFEDATIKGGLLLLGNLGSARLQAVINASVNDTNSETVSNPKLFAMNGQAATITQGITIKKVIAGSANAASETTDVALNLNLNVTPRIRGDKIELQISLNNSSPGETDASGVGASDVPINTEAVNSTIQISDGDVAIMGGVYKAVKADNNNRVPLLSRIPVLGTFFETKTNTDNKTQLLIFITARIV